MIDFVMKQIANTLTHLSLAVLDSNAQAIGFYSSQGFIDTAQRYHERVYDVELVDIKMEKQF